MISQKLKREAQKEIYNTQYKEHKALFVQFTKVIKTSENATLRFCKATLKKSYK